eukprot:Filipodium_phascolosomae@DN2475_c0_g1_i1.p2
MKAKEVYCDPHERAVDRPKVEEVNEDDEKTCKQETDADEKETNDDDAVDGADSSAAPDTGNGGTGPGYKWSQTLGAVDVVVEVPPASKSKDLRIEIRPRKLLVGVKGKTTIIDGLLHGAVKTEDCMWTLTDGHIVQINLEKVDQMRWWSSVIVGDPEIDTRKIVPENSKLSDLDGETRATVEKMMFDQNQKARGLPTSEQSKQWEMLEKFKKAHPEMDFSQAKINLGGGGGFNM